MKRAWILLLVLSLSCTVRSTLRPIPVDLTAVTYNLHYLDHGVADVVKTLAPINADVIAMQEVLVRGGVVYSMEIGRQLGLGGVNSAPYVAYGDSQWVLAILTKHPILLVDQRSLGCCRRALRVLLRVNNVSVNFITMHLTPFSGDKPLKQSNLIRYQARKAEIKDLLAWVKDLKEPTVLLGDFNMLRGPTRILWGMDEHQQVVDAGFDDADGGYLPTNHDTFPIDEFAKSTASNSVPRCLVPSGITLDYVFTSPNVNVLNTRVVESDASDHYPLIARLRIMP
ncbi:MAG: endonuclease/exonuclease/phosphatase family protein [Spirochaetia bacterium]|nr:endonuclease/exonuclease/phosphatase family protein [Spirochaetia bacterium]